MAFTSRIGNQYILVPYCVNIIVKKQRVLVNGPKGKLSFTLPPFLTIEWVKITGRKHIFVDYGLQSYLDAPLTRKLSNELYGLTRTSVSNIIKGVAKGFQKRLRLTGVGYRATIENGCLVLNVGYSQIIKVVIPNSISLQCETPTNLIISGIKKDQVGNFASKIRSIRPPEPYKGKGISYGDELIHRKPGKTGK